VKGHALAQLEAPVRVIDDLPFGGQLRLVLGGAAPVDQAVPDVAAGGVVRRIRILVRIKRGDRGGHADGQMRLLSKSRAGSGGDQGEDGAMEAAPGHGMHQCQVPLLDVCPPSAGRFDRDVAIADAPTKRNVRPMCQFYFPLVSLNETHKFTGRKQFSGEARCRII
jgi:hypothetical protein